MDKDIERARRYVKTMPDSQVRDILGRLATRLQEALDEIERLKKENSVIGGEAAQIILAKKMVDNIRVDKDEH